MTSENVQPRIDKCICDGCGKIVRSDSEEFIHMMSTTIRFSIPGWLGRTLPPAVRENFGVYDEHVCMPLDCCERSPKCLVNAITSRLNKFFEATGWGK